MRWKTGGKGIRTPGLLIANETLYQLSYTPVIDGRILARLARHSNFNSGFTLRIFLFHVLQHLQVSHNRRRQVILFPGDG
jgi:hypothetical protein